MIFRAVLSSGIALLSLGLSACSQLSAEAPVKAIAAPEMRPAGPAIWRLADDDTEIFLFGTIHLLPEDLKWQTAALTEILNRADILYLETYFEGVSRTERQAYSAIVTPKPGEALADYLSASEQQNLLARIPDSEWLATQFSTRKPWVIALIIGKQSLNRLGYEDRYGAESWLTEQAEKAGKEIRSIDDSMSTTAILLSALTPEIQVNMVEEAVRDIPDLGAQFEKGVNVWMSGDMDNLHAAIMADLENNLPEVYDAIIVQRNQNWTEEIDRLMREETGVFLIAVGAGHLTGEASLTLLLEAKGYEVSRY